LNIPVDTVFLKAVITNIFLWSFSHFVYFISFTGFSCFFGALDDFL